MTASKMYWACMAVIAVLVYFLSRKNLSLGIKTQYKLEITGHCLVSVGAATMSVVIITCAVIISGLAKMLRIKMPF